MDNVVAGSLITGYLIILTFDGECRSGCSLIAFLRGYNVSSLTRYNRYITLRFHF